MKRLADFILESCSYRKCTEASKAADNVNDLYEFASFINKYPNEWLEYREEIAERNGWKLGDKKRVICKDMKTRECVKYNDNDKKYRVV